MTEILVNKSLQISPQAQLSQLVQICGNTKNKIWIALEKLLQK